MQTFKSNSLMAAVLAGVAAIGHNAAINGFRSAVKRGEIVMSNREISALFVRARSISSYPSRPSKTAAAAKRASTKRRNVQRHRQHAKRAGRK